jgi:hypothetical protein
MTDTYRGVITPSRAPQSVNVSTSDALILTILITNTLQRLQPCTPYLDKFNKNCSPIPTRFWSSYTDLRKIPTRNLHSYQRVRKKIYPREAQCLCGFVKKFKKNAKKNLFISIHYIYICPVQLLNTFIDILTYTTETATATLRRAPVPIILNP